MIFTASGTEVSTFEEYAAAAWPSLYRYAYLLAGTTRTPRTSPSRR